MEALLNENNVLTLIELVEWRRVICALQDEGENVSSELDDFKCKMEQFIANMKNSLQTDGQVPSVVDGQTDRVDMDLECDGLNH
jgi:hypothetical protein